MTEIRLELNEDLSSYLHEVAAKKNSTPSAVIDEMLRERRIIQEFGSVENFDKIIQEARDSGFVEVNDEFWQNLENEILNSIGDGNNSLGKS